MITPAYIQLMARYNTEMNRRIYAAAARLSDEQRRADVGLFWKSLHGTLCHLLWGDRQWMSRLDGWPPNTIPNPQSPTLIHDFAELRAAREEARQAEASGKAKAEKKAAAAGPAKFQQRVAFLF